MVEAITHFDPLTGECLGIPDDLPGDAVRDPKPTIEAR
jgi:hypothetical protein